MALAAWAVFAFAGAYNWTLVPLAAGAVLLAISERPSIFRAPYRVLDTALIVWLTLAAAMLAPLPASARRAIAPHAAAVDRALYVESPTQPLDQQARPVSVDPGATMWALVMAGAVLLIFWSARSILNRHGLRATARGLAWIGLALSALALVQHATSPTLMYWYFHPIASKATPFGPYVNRNDLTTWLLLAIPLVAGYGIARFTSRQRTAGGPIDLEASVDATALWLAASVLLMLATVLAATSRSGLTGTVVGLAVFMWLARTRLGASGWTWLAAVLFALLALATTYANWNSLASRLDETLAVGIGGRRAVWAQTWPMVRDFWISGVGVGAYERAMTVYQQTPHAFYINHAHNEYLQLLAEGGVLLAVPAALAVCAVVWLAAGQLRDDHSPVFWIRAGAASGLLAAAVQGIWDTGLRLPGNAVLFALLAAIALHDPRAKPGR
ncbi:MAG: O-antigen ligase family protein [Acidobacteriia bacterium]|nr:O-antigen ligase family protein [Terriglobia bacterium]